MENKVTPIIGLEIHVELTTKSKMFCGCPADHFGKEPNSQTCPVCLGLPGALPVPNQKAIEDTVKIGLALDCQISKNPHFDRKQYFYPDLPKGYQISQYGEPLCLNGSLTLDSGKKIRLIRVHLEEDTGKLQHTTLNGEKVSLIDFNRSGVPLVEIVIAPDLASPEEAKECLKKIHQLVRELSVSQADMEKGQMRLEPTVNLNIDGQPTPLVELKNINSFNFAVQAIEYEIKRQAEEFARTGEIKTESNKTTRGYDSEKKITFPQRAKEEAKDYRYFPEPDIPPLVISDTLIDQIKARLPRLPEQIKKELIALGLDSRYAEVIHKDKGLLALVESFREEEGIDLPRLANFLVNKKIDANLPQEEIKAAYQKLLETGETDQEKLIPLVQKVIAANPDAVTDYRKGKINALGFLVGQAKKLSGGQANAQALTRVLLQLLASDSKLT